MMSNHLGILVAVRTDTFDLISNTPTSTIHVYSIDIITVMESHHSLPCALPTRTSALLPVKLSSLRHQTHAEQLVHHTRSGPLGCDLLQDVPQYICEI